MIGRLKSLYPTLLLIARWVLLAAVLAFAVSYLVGQWTAVQAAVRQIAPLSLVASAVSVVLGLCAVTMSWVTLLNGLVVRVVS